MATTLLTPLAINVPLIDPETGNPTPLFQRILQQLLKEKAVTDTLAEDAVPQTRILTAGTGLTGGGDLTTDRSFAIDTTAEAERIRDVIGACLVNGSNITITVNDPGDTITIAASGGGGGSYEGGPVGTVPLSSGLTWVNQGTSTVIDGTNALILNGQNSVARSLVKATPAAPFDVYCRVKPYNFAAVNTNTIGGIMFRNSGTGNQVSFHTEVFNEGYRIGIFRWNSGGGFVTGTIATNTGYPIYWLRCNVTSTTITCYVSADGLQWTNMGTTENIASYITTVNQYGVFVDANAGNPTAVFKYFSTTAPV